MYGFTILIYQINFKVKSSFVENKNRPKKQCSFFCLDDNRPKETETHDDISGNWWLNFIAVQSEVAESRSTFIKWIAQIFDRHGTDTWAAHSCKLKKKGVNVIRMDRFQMKNSKELSFK